MSFSSGSDRDAATRRGPYVDSIAFFRPDDDSSHHYPTHSNSQSRSPKRDNFIDLTGDSSPPPSQSHRAPQYRLGADRATPPGPKVEGASIFPLGPTRNTSNLSDPSGGSTAVSSNAASVLDPSPPPVSIQTSVDLDDGYDAEMPRLTRPPDGTVKTPQQVTPPSSTRPSSHQSPKHGPGPKRTPNKGISDFTQVVNLLKEYSKDIAAAHQELCIYVLKSTKPAETRVKTGVDFFAGVSLSPTTEKKGTTMKIRAKVSATKSLCSCHCAPPTYLAIRVLYSFWNSNISAAGSRIKAGMFITYPSASSPTKMPSPSTGSTTRKSSRMSCRQTLCSSSSLLSGISSQTRSETINFG